MMTGQLATAVMAAFTGAAFYVGWAEHPARLGLAPDAALAHWKRSYPRGFVMQGSLALIGTVLGVWAFLVWIFLGEGSWLSLAGALAALANWPYTYKAIMPVNTRLEETAPENAGPETMALLVRWGWLHAARTGFGLLSTLCFLAA